MSWRETLGVTFPTEAPNTHNSHNAQKSSGSGHCADCAEFGYRDSQEADSTLLRPWRMSARVSTSHPRTLRCRWQRRISRTGARIRSARQRWRHSRTLWAAPGYGAGPDPPQASPSARIASAADRSGCGSPVRCPDAPGAGTALPGCRYPAVSRSAALTAFILSASITRTLAIAPRASRNGSPDCGTRTNGIANAFYQGHSKSIKTYQGP